jgi:hypothetical protein
MFGFGAVDTLLLLRLAGLETIPSVQDGRKHCAPHRHADTVEEEPIDWCRGRAHSRDRRNDHYDRNPDIASVPLLNDGIPVRVVLKVGTQ